MSGLVSVWPVVFGKMVYGHRALVIWLLVWVLGVIFLIHSMTTWQ